MMITRVLTLCILALVFSGCAQLEQISQASGSPETVGRAIANSLSNALAMDGENPTVLPVALSRSKIDDSHRFGSIMTDQIATHLVANDVDVVEALPLGSYMTSPADGRVITDAIRRQGGYYNTDAALLGTYTIGNQHVFINARIIDLDSGIILAATAAELRRSSDVDRLLGLHTDTGSLVPGFDEAFNQSMCCSLFPDF